MGEAKTLMQDGGASQASKRVLYFDLLNIGACLCVIFLHCNSMVHTFVPGKNWVLALAIECVFYWAVPIFFMLTGATLMRYRERYDTKTFFKKRLLRTLVPFVLWNVIWFIALPGVRTEGPLTIGRFFSMMMSNKIVSIYWFFFPLFSIYLSMPALSYLSGKTDLLKYLVLVSFVLQSVAPQVCSLLNLSWNSSMTILVASGHLLFVILGYLLATQDINKRQRYVIYAFGLFGLLLRFIYTLVLSESSGELDRTFFNYLGFPSVLYSTAVFVWFKYHDWSFLRKYGHRIAALSACSFGIYLIHRPLLDGIIFGALGVDRTSILMRTAGAVLYYCFLLFLVYVLRKVPGVKRLFP